MRASECREKSVVELSSALLMAQRQQCTLRLQAAGSQLKQTHLIKQLRRSIARIKTVLAQRQEGVV